MLDSLTQNCLGVINDITCRNCPRKFGRLYLVSRWSKFCQDILTRAITLLGESTYELTHLHFPIIFLRVFQRKRKSSMLTTSLRVLTVERTLYYWVAIKANFMLMLEQNSKIKKWISCLSTHWQHLLVTCRLLNLCIWKEFWVYSPDHLFVSTLYYIILFIYCFTGVLKSL